MSTADTTLLQLEQHFQQLSAHLDELRQQVAAVHAESNQSSRQLATLIEHLTDSERIAPLVANVAEMATALDTTQSQLEELTRRTARQEQLERLVAVVAGQSQLEELNENLKKLTRTQFKSNTLAESKTGQVEQSLTTLRALATQRAEIQQQQSEHASQQLNEAHRAGRAAFAAELLPALDSLELALTTGGDLLTRQRERAAVLLQQDVPAADVRSSDPTTTAPTRGFWQRLLGSTATVDTPAPAGPTAAAGPLLREFASATEQAISAWLAGLTLVSERLTALLAAEEIKPIDALHQPFDPRLHVAVESVTRSDVAPDTVVRVLRQGYHRHDRVLRYAEVVVARPPTS
jgi:molecular chaperone GrpE (heat shock protein)